MRRSFAYKQALTAICLAGCLCWLAAPAALAGDGEPPRLLRNPSLSADQVAFLFADEIWAVSRNGGKARRLTRGARAQDGPFFSPDGRWVAYSASMGDGGDASGSDIFIVETSGGEPRRLTWHPGDENPIGWTRDGLHVIFSSNRQSGLRNAPKIFRTAADGSGAPAAYPLPTGTDLAFSPGGERVAYTPLGIRSWKGYRGGRAPYIWLVDLATLDLEVLPHGKASDWNPLWVGDRVYFLSDRAGPVGLYAYDVDTRRVRRVLESDRFDFMSAAAGPDGVIVIDAFDSIRLYDPGTGELRTVPIRIEGTFDALEPRSAELAPERAVSRALSPDGTQYAIEARGEIFIAPAHEGTARNVTNSAGVADRAPSWSPDGALVAYTSDASGEYQLVIRPADGSGTPRVLALGAGHGVFSDFCWSPDGRHISYVDETTTLWILDVASGASVKVAKDPHGVAMTPPRWSPDGAWLAYVTKGSNLMGQAFLYSVDSGTSVPVTDGRTDVFSPVFDRGGRYLYFLAGAERMRAQTASMSSNDRPSRANLYAALLSAGTLPPRSLQEAAAAGAPGPDLAGLSSRIVRLPVPEREYGGLEVGAAGVVYLTERAVASGPGQTVYRLNWPEEKFETFLVDVTSFDLSDSGATAVVRRPGAAALVPVKDIHPGTAGAPPVVPGGQPVNTAVLPVEVDPRAEHRQVFREAWRFVRDLFYAGDYHGLDLAKAEARYAPFIAGLGSRTDLTYLVREMTTNLGVSHLGVRNPPPDDPAFGVRDGEVRHHEAAGLLGANYAVDNNRYRFTRIYRGDVWLDSGAGPLARPGIEVKEGDYLVAVNGRELHATDNLYRAFEGLAGHETDIRVAPGPTGAGARVFRVTPIRDEFGLRHSAWIEDKRRMTDRLGDGKVGYVYVINTGEAGYAGFNRQYLAQVGKAGVVIDERNNGGGPIADFIVNQMLRTRLVQVWPRYGDTPITFPVDYINGPAAMIINETAGSGGDILPYMFRKANAGPLVGKRTWGGSVGSGPVPTLLDGGTMNVPHFPISDPDGTWGGLEASGTPPDIEVEQDPKSVAAGRDPQLEAAVQAVLDQLQEQPRPAPQRPPVLKTRPDLVSPR